MQETFAKALRGKRRELGLTQEALADLAGISAQAISLLERGVRRFPQRITLDRLADALRLNPADRSAFERIAARGVVPTDAANSSSKATMPWSIPQHVAVGTSAFVGRSDQLTILVERLMTQPVSPGSPTLATIRGMAGVGKTALGLQVARSVAGHYPDGSVFVDLRGFGPGARLTPQAALGQILRATGVPPEEVPGRAEDAATAYRTRLAGRRMLLVLDNAVEVAQVADLIPASEGCAVLITSRNTLTTIGAGLHIQLDPMSIDDSLDLFTAISGARRDDPDSAAVIELCGRLPLAISVAGAWLASSPGWTPHSLAGRLNDEGRRLDLLGGDDLDVRTSLSFSIEQLAASGSARDTMAIRAFALLSVPEGPDISAEIAAPLLEVSVLDADRSLERLVDLHLLESTTPGRYHLHDLVRAYARELVSPAERTAAFSRYLAFHLAAAWQITKLADPGSARLSWYDMAEHPPGPELNSSVEAVNWIEVEHPNIRSLISQAAALPDHSENVAGLVIALFRYFTGRGHLTEWLDAIDIVIGGTIHPWSLAQLQADAGIALAELARYDDSLQRLQEAARTFAAVGDLRGQSMAANNTARLLTRIGRFSDARPYAEDALELNRGLDDKRAISKALSSLSEICGELGESDAELEYSLLSLEYSRTVGERSSSANGQIDLAVAHSRQGLSDLALTEARQGLAELTELGLSANCSDGRCWIGWILARADRHEEATAEYEAGLDLAIQLADRRREAQIRRRLGTSQLALSETREGLLNLEFAATYYRERNSRAASQIDELLKNPDLATEVARRPGLL